MFIRKLLVFIFLLEAASYQAQVTHKLDVEKSSLIWVGRKIVGEHSGHLNFKSGFVDFQKSVFRSGVFDIDMRSLTLIDLKGEMADKLLNHLNSESFFQTKKYPTAQLVIKSGIQDKNSSILYHFMGDLTIKGITKEIKWKAEVEKNGQNLVVKSNFNIDRTLFNVRYGSNNFFENLGDKAINDEFSISIHAVLLEQ